MNFAQISTRCRLTVSLEVLLSQQRSSFNQISAVSSNMLDPSSMSVVTAQPPIFLCLCPSMLPRVVRLSSLCHLSFFSFSFALVYYDRGQPCSTCSPTSHFEKLGSQTPSNGCTVSAVFLPILRRISAQSSAHDAALAHRDHGLVSA